jgi:hypothetical protein
MPKSQTVSGAAGDLHSMALKSAISNIGIALVVVSIITFSAAFCEKTLVAETDVVRCVTVRVTSHNIVTF